MLFQVGVVDGVVMDDVEKVGEGKFFVEQGGKIGGGLNGKIFPANPPCVLEAIEYLG